MKHVVITAVLASRIASATKPARQWQWTVDRRLVSDWV